MNRAICGDFKPENYPAVQSIYVGFVERNIPDIPRPLSSRGSKGLLHEKKKKMSVQTRFFILIVSGFCSRRPFCFAQSADSVCPKPTVPNPTYVVKM